MFGPWWAYRALLVVDRALPPAAAPPGDGCAGCAAPCVAACPAGAVARAGFDVPACHARRLAAEPCRLSCAARIACVRGPEHRYSRRPARLPHGGVDAEALAGRLTAGRAVLLCVAMATPVNAHITGTVWKIEVKVGDTVAEGQTVVILESMKMEMPVESPRRREGVRRPGQGRRLRRGGRAAGRDRLTLQRVPSPPRERLA